MNDLSDSSCPIAPAVRRFSDGLSLLIETKQNHFEPDRFRISLNNTIQTLRNVTFVLQKAKSVLPKFDIWYSSWQERMRTDALMKWLVTARNIIVKEGDLKTHSIARISILESWFEPPKFEMEVDPFTHTEDFARLLGEQVPEGIPWDVGIMCVERRWVHEELPEYEILDCLVHSFSVFGELLYDAHNALLDEKSREQCPWFATLKGISGKLPPCMVAQDWDRTVWIDLRDNSVMTPVVIPIKQSEEELNQAAERYPGINDFKRKLSATTSLEEQADVLFKQAKNMLQTDGYHSPIAIIGYPDGTERISQLKMEDRTAKHLVMRMLAVEIERTRATSIILINEVWLSRGRKLPRSGHAGDDPNREEALQLVAEDSSGQIYVHTAVFIRDAQKKIHFTEEHKTTTDTMNILQPIRVAWNRMKR